MREAPRRLESLYNMAGFFAEEKNMFLLPQIELRVTSRCDM
jgi:hypothetical protein